MFGGFVAPQRGTVGYLIRENYRSTIRWTRVRGPYNNNRFSGVYDFTITTAHLGGSVTAGSLQGVSLHISTLFENIFEYVRLSENLLPRDMLQCVVVSNLHVWTKLIFVMDMTPEYVMELIERTLDSQETLILENAIITVRYYRQYRFSGGFNPEYVSPGDLYVSKKKSIVKVLTTNNCFWVCLALGIMEHRDSLAYKQLVSGGHRRKERQEAAGEVYRTQCEGFEMAVNLDEIRQMEDKFKISIMIVNFEGMMIEYGGTKKYSELMCCLKVPNENGSHLHYVKKDFIGQLWSKRKFCRECRKGYANDRHKCVMTCRACKRSCCKGREVSSWDLFIKFCPTCNCKFFDEKCFAYHRKKFCGKFTRCLECGCLYEREEQHICNMKLCTNCKFMVPMFGDHECFHQRLTKEELPKPSKKYIYYDYETYLDEDNVHVVCAIVAMKQNSKLPIRFFSTRTFLDWLLTEKHKGYSVIAHNSGRYDFHFIKQELLKRNIQSNDVCNGNTIFYSVIPKFNIRFLDSYRLISIPLRSFPKSFGLKEVKKGYFPYRFLTKETKGYVGEMPAVEWFDFDNMREHEREEALKWYDTVKGTKVCLMEMCWSYCESDVILLKEGCTVFRELFLEMTDDEVDPFQFITIASVCMTVYRRFYLPERSIGVVEQVSEDNLYKKQLWERWTQDQLGGEIPSNMVYKICVDHGCKKCFSPFTKHPKTGIFMKDLYYESTKDDRKKNVTWEHDFKIEGAVKEFEEKYFIYEENTLNVRDAFYGGRTEPIKLYKKVKNNERISYYDYTSLYPSVQFGKLRGVTVDTYDVWEELMYPCGHGRHIKNVTPDKLHKYFGFVKCDITPPDDLYLPILPEKKNGKLMFDLTPKVAGTWTIKEVLLAMKYGYVVTKIYDVLHYEKLRSDLFRGYVQCFYRMKIIATGWGKLGIPVGMERRVFLKTLERTYGIELEESDIPEGNNPGMYLISKLCLNSLWGKYGQRDNFSNTADVYEWSEFQKIVDMDDVEILGVIMHGSNARTLTFRKLTAFVSAPKYTNIAIAAYTTAHARCRLYQALEYLDPKDVVYMDTDSIICVEHDNTPVLKTGEFLGDLTSELGEGDYIEEYVSTGPKSYAYRCKSGKEELKVKGITLSHTTKRKLNFDTLVEMTKKPKLEVTTNPLQFVIDKHHVIRTKVHEEGKGKVFRLTMNKRKIDWKGRSEDELDTRPFKR
jgi:hypothetical protein